MISKKTFAEKVAYAINNNEIALFVAAGLSASTILAQLSRQKSEIFIMN